jgi:hypothetical protein
VVLVAAGRALNFGSDFRRIRSDPGARNLQFAPLADEDAAPLGAIL